MRNSKPRFAKGRDEVAAVDVPADLRLFENSDPAGPSMTDPDLLVTITVPILLLEGERTKPVFTRGNRHVAEHAPKRRESDHPWRRPCRARACNRSRRHRAHPFPRRRPSACLTGQ